MIPPIVHFVWVGSALPDWADRNIREFRRLNPAYQVRVHGEDVLLPEYRQHYDAERSVGPRSDLLRYSALERFKGWYWDTDFWPLRPLDDIERAFGLADGRRLFVARQRGQHNAALRISNGVLAAPQTCPALAEIKRRILAMRPGTAGWARFGPVLLTSLFDERPGLFAAGTASFFFPFGIGGQAVTAYRSMVEGGASRQSAADWTPDTAGQVPFALHLWAAGKDRLPPEPDLLRRTTSGAGPLRGLPVGVVATQTQWADTTQPFQAVAAGLERLGCRVEVRVPGPWPVFAHDPQVIVLWNGRRSPYREIAGMSEAAGRVVLRMEHGFLGDRRANVQIDHAGILHWASWATPEVLQGPAPAGASDRLRAVWPDRLVPPAGRRSGYPLILAQVPHDTQLQDAAICLPRDLAREIAGAVPGGMRPALRPHPKGRNWIGQARKYATILDGDGDFAEAVAGARFAVTVNSNAANLCLAMGLPVACFGPALPVRAGVARLCERGTLWRDMDAMLRGWCPDPNRTANYLRHLAARQYGQDELRSGGVLARLIREGQAARRRGP